MTDNYSKWDKSIFICKWVLTGALAVFLVVISIFRLVHGDNQLGEFMLYFFTVWFCVHTVFFRQVDRFLKRGVGKVLRVIMNVFMLIFVGVLVFLIIACHGDDVDCSEKYVIVLGAPIYKERTSDILAARITLAHEFMVKDQDCVAVVTGGNSLTDKYKDVLAEISGEMGNETLSDEESEAVSDFTSEAVVMGVVLQSWKDEPIAEERIFYETKAKNTVDNFKNSVKILQEECGYDGSEPVVIITNNFHSYRVRGYAKMAGLTNFKVLVCHQSIPDSVVWYIREVPSTVLFWAQMLFSK